MLCSFMFKTYILFATCDFINDGEKYVNVSARDAITISSERDMLLPTPEIVEAINKQARCRIYTTPKDPAKTESMVDQSIQAMKQKSSCSGLISGHYKSIVESNGQIGLYGWYTRDGERIQNFFSGHSLDYVDYSQALRLIHKVGIDLSTSQVIDVSELLKNS